MTNSVIPYVFRQPIVILYQRIDGFEMTVPESDCGSHLAEAVGYWSL